MNSTIGLKGSLTCRKFKTHSMAPFSWKLRNILRWAYLRGEIAWYIGRPIAKALGLVQYTFAEMVQLLTMGYWDDVA